MFTVDVKQQHNININHENIYPNNISNCIYPEELPYMLYVVGAIEDSVFVLNVQGPNIILVKNASADHYWLSSHYPYKQFFSRVIVYLFYTDLKSSHLYGECQSNHWTGIQHQDSSYKPTGWYSITSSADPVCLHSNVLSVYTVNSLYLRIECHLKLLISQSKSSGPRKFTLRYP